MQTTRKFNEIRLCDKLSLETIQMQALLGCGRSTAIKIGEAAGARIQIGKRVLWSVPKLQKYLEEISK